MSAGMAEVIAAHPGHEIRLDDQLWVQVCFGCPWRYRYSDSSGLEAHAAHVAEELAKAVYGNVQEAKAEALTDAANWLANGEAAAIVAYDGPSNRGEVMAAYDSALEDPEAWLRERAAAALAVDPADLYREERDGMAEAWGEGHTAVPGTLNPYEDPAPLAAAMADPEGRALVQAIHDRKVGT